MTFCRHRTGARPLARLLAVAITAAAGACDAQAETALERGSYLVNAVMACDGCHTPRQPGGFAMARRFSLPRGTG